MSPATAVAPVLNTEQVRAFVDDGYLIVEGLVSPAEVDELRADTVRLARGEYPCESLQPMPAELSDQQVTERILCIHQPHYISPVIERYVRHEAVCAVLGQVTAAHLPHWDGSVKCMQSMLFVKPPGFQGHL